MIEAVVRRLFREFVTTETWCPEHGPECTLNGTFRHPESQMKFRCTPRGVAQYISKIHQRGMLSSECIIIAYAYLERFHKHSSCVRFNAQTLHVLLTIALMLASKVWDDLRCVSCLL